MATRIFALFFSLLTLANLLGNGLWPGFDANVWWIRFDPLPGWLVRSILAVSAFTLLAFAVRRPERAARSWWTAGVALNLSLVALLNAAAFYWLLLARKITAGIPIPFSLIICLGMLLVAYTAWSGHRPPARFPFWRLGAGVVCLGAAFPLALMLFFGNTDYRRPADAVVVLGSRTYTDGHLSDALEDRVRTGCELYRKGLAKRLVFSGGPGDGAVTEAAGMRRYALSHGVRAEDIFMDEHGLNTEATVRNTVPLFREWGAERVLVVSHFYHLPRIKLAYQRAGMNVFTVPARQAHVIGQLPFNLAREIAAFWTYYLKYRPGVIAAPG